MTESSGACCHHRLKTNPSPSMQKSFPFPEKSRILLLIFCYWVLDQELSFLWFGVFFVCLAGGFLNSAVSHGNYSVELTCLLAAQL